MAPNTFTFGDIGSNAPSAAGLMGRPRRLPTKNGCGVGVCWADSEVARMASGRVSFTTSSWFMSMSLTDALHKEAKLIGSISQEIHALDNSGEDARVTKRHWLRVVERVVVPVHFRQAEDGPSG